MSNFISKIVGLSGATNPAPPDGAFLVNDLPVISNAFATSLSKSGDASPINDVWNRTMLNADKTLSKDLKVELMKEVQFRKLISSSLEFYSSTGTRAASARYEGARYDLGRSRYTKITFKQVYVAGSGTFDIRIFNLVTGLQVFEKLNQTVNGEGYFDIDFSVNIDKLENVLFACVDASAVTLQQMNANRGFLSDSSGGYNVQVSSGSINKLLPITKTNYVQSASFVHFVVDIESDLDNFLEVNAKIFQTAAWYLCGYHLLMESLSTDNFNIFTNTNRVEREKQMAINYNMYCKYRSDAIQEVMMIMAPTPQVAPKSAEEKPGIQKFDMLGGSGFDVYDYLPGYWYPE